MGKQKNAQGEVANTHAQAAITWLTVCMSNVITEYTQSYDTLLTLGVMPCNTLPLQPLSIKQLDGLMSLLKGDQNLGEGTRHMPWFWTVHDLSSDMTTQPKDKPLINDEEYKDEWFYGRERFRQWQEEEYLLWEYLGASFELENGAPLAHRSQMHLNTPEPDAISVEEMGSHLLETACQNSIHLHMKELVAEELAQLMNTNESDLKSDSEEPDPKLVKQTRATSL
ncbi:hypothetical protein FRC11_008287 [Ceratobasidium sp. 423]|nr:hypothetical protein FRC11_008287 [Ceratobasidium sp. 423]